MDGNHPPPADPASTQFDLMLGTRQSNMTELEATQSALDATRDELHRLAALQAGIQETERRRIARELHDDLLQTLAAIRIDLGQISQRLHGDTTQIPPLLAELDALAEQAIVSTRRIVVDLRPRLLEDLGVLPALQALASQFTQRTGIACTMKSDGAATVDFSESPELATCLYRVCQEMLNNAGKHSQATLVDIVIDAAMPGQLELRVVDNGRGMQPGDSRKPESFGLLGMRERVRALGGTLRLESAPGTGTSIYITLPFKTCRPEV